MPALFPPQCTCRLRYDACKLQWAFLKDCRHILVFFQSLTNSLQVNNQPHIELCIEPALFEWGGWFRNGMPQWMPPEELAGASHYECAEIAN